MSVGLGVMLMGGCAYGEVRQVVRAQFASEFDCPEVQLKKRELWYSYEGPDQFKAIGCGKVRTYTCPENTGLVPYGEPVCTFVEGDADAPKTVHMAPLGEDEPEPPMDDSSGGEDTGGGDVGNDQPEPQPESEPAPAPDSGSSDGDGLSGDSDLEGESSTPAPAAHGAASGGVHVGGGVKVGGGAKTKSKSK